MRERIQQAFEREIAHGVKADGLTTAPWQLDLLILTTPTDCNSISTIKLVKADIEKENTQVLLDDELGKPKTCQNFNQSILEKTTW